MPKLRHSDTQLLNELFDMSGGYVLGFSDKTMAEFFDDALDVDIDDVRFKQDGTSKANRVRSFLNLADAATAIRALNALWDARKAFRERSPKPDTLPNAEARFVELLGRMRGSPQTSASLDGASVHPARDLSALRGALQPLIEALATRGPNHALGKLCADLGMPVPPDLATKRERMVASFSAVPDADLPRLTESFLTQFPPGAGKRNQLQDLLHPDGSGPAVPVRYRRELARGLSTDELYRNSGPFDELLDRLWDLDFDPTGGWSSHSVVTLREQIDRHVHRNPGDWTAEQLFDYLGAYESSDWRFETFLEGLASPALWHDEPLQRGLVDTVNRALRPCGVELRESGTQGGYPTFDLVSSQGTTRGSPKNLIFASRTKPDLRFRDAIDNDVEVVCGADDVLIYDRPISARDGLQWRDLQSWWAEQHQIADPIEAKRSLYRRLANCLPNNSPPQAAVFHAYYKALQPQLPNAPALLPEVWLHWDPVAVKVRGKDALLRFRMDFLLLLPHGRRVVIEVDGMHHYAHDNGRADPNRYSNLVRADRELKLAGYEVFRFGATELQEPDAAVKVRDFFVALLKRFSPGG